MTDLVYIFQRLNENSSENLRETEAEIYEIIKEEPDNAEVLIALMQVNILMGQKQKAKALANRIWEIGGKFEKYIEINFINNLINLGMVEMASVLLKPRFERLSENAKDFIGIFLKFSVVTGNSYLLEKSNIYTLQPDEKILINDFIKVYEILKYSDHFKAMQRLLLDISKENLCRYEYKFLNERNFSELNLTLYTDLLPADCDILWQKINSRLDLYCQTNQITRMDNVHFDVKSLR